MKSFLKSWGNFTVSCSGTVIGGSWQFLIYLERLLGHEPFWQNGKHWLDQTYHNFLLHMGEFKNRGIKKQFLDCNSQFLTMHYCSRGKKDTLGGGCCIGESESLSGGCSSTSVIWWSIENPKQNLSLKRIPLDLPRSSVRFHRLFANHKDHYAGGAYYSERRESNCWKMWRSR
jgi:hypothetical protein